MFKGNEEAEAGNTKTGCCLSRNFFLLVSTTASDHSTTLVYEVHTCPDHLLCLLSTEHAQTTFESRAVRKAAPGHAIIMSVIISNQYNNNQYFIELFTEVGGGGLPPLQR